MATRLPDGSVVVRTPGTRAYPASGSGATKVRTPSQAAGGGPGARTGSAVRAPQPGRTAASKDAYH